jgi:hypothetical protein
LALGDGFEPLGQALEGADRLRSLSGFGVRPSLGGFGACLCGAARARASARASRMPASSLSSLAIWAWTGLSGGLSPGLSRGLSLGLSPGLVNERLPLRAP